MVYYPILSCLIPGGELPDDSSTAVVPAATVPTARLQWACGSCESLQGMQLHLWPTNQATIARPSTTMGRRY